MSPYRLVSSEGDQSFELPPGRSVVVGRGLASDIPLYDPTISRRHAELTAGPDGVQVTDLGSSNGTCINGSRVTSGRLGPDDSITFGKVVFRLRGPRPSEGGIPVAAELGPPAGTIVRQLVVSGGVPPGLTSRDGPNAGSQLRVSATRGEARQAMKLSMLLDVSQKLSSELELEKLLRTVVDMTFEIMNVDRVTIVLRNEQTGDLVPTISRSRLGDVQAQQVPRSIAEKVIEERVAVVSQNAAADSRFKGQSIVMQSVRSAMCSPLMASADRVLGLLYVDNVTAPNSFTDEDLQFLVAFSGLAALGIKNSRYAEQIRREAMVRSNFERYFAPNVAFEHGGTLDKFIGDAIMALWGAPIAHPGDPDRAIHAAVAMQRAIAELNQRWASQGRPEIGVGIGINHGDVFAGNIGSHRRLEYTVIGDAVNVAARLCAEAGPGEILVSEAFLRVLREQVECEFLPEMGLKGKAQVVQVYRVRPDGVPIQRASVTSVVPARPSKR